MVAWGEEMMDEMDEARTTMLMMTMNCLIARL